MRSAVLYSKRSRHLRVRAHGMKIEILYVDGCPNQQPAIEGVREVLREDRLSAEIVEVKVGDASMARELKFLGSPSIRINGLDVEPEMRTACDYGMTCRTYAVNGR